MDASDAIIAVVKVAGDNILGRTAIQKIVYFLSVFEFVEELKRSNAADFNEISRIVEICRKSENFKPEILSWAAKVNYILSKKKEPMTYDAIISTAGSFCWGLSSKQIEKALEIFQKLG